ncbi:MAG: HlyD family efflux transporter periplasmic adaptor subunit [Planctomycetota bacterium]
MSDWRPILIRTVASITLLAVGVGGVLMMSRPEVPKEPPKASAPTRVLTAIANAHDEGIAFDVDGLVVPYRQIDLATQVSGRVKFKSDSCRVGKTVKKGDLLIEIEPDDYLLEVTRLTEELEQASAMIRELTVEVETLDNQISTTREQLAIDQRQLERALDLSRRRAGSSTELDAARRTQLATQSALQSQVDQKRLLVQRESRLESAVQLVKANLDKANLDLQRTKILAPFDGIVVSESVEQDGFVATGNPVVRLQDTSQLDVTCKLHMRQMNWLWQGNSETTSNDDGYQFPSVPATVIFAIDGVEYAWNARVDRYDGAGLDSLTRMVPCRVHVESPTESRLLESIVPPAGTDEVSSDTDSSGDSATKAAEILAAGARDTNPPALMTGMFVKVRVHARPPLSMMRLPQEAIQPGNAVWVVEDERLIRRKVSIATSTPDHVIVYQRSGGLQAGDQVVVSPLAAPFDGMPVATGPPPKEIRPRAGRGGRPGGRS